ncbi:MAG: FAD-binding protein, partial [Nitrososphaerales archaeon]|nr:FAD-binding protein [Nitrososphaerales archaeon]
ARLSALLAEDAPHAGLTGTLWIMMFVFLGPPRGQLRLFWRRLADLDTPAQDRRIESLARELRERLSGQSRVATGRFERQIHSRDIARVPHCLQKLMHHTRPHLLVQPMSEEDVLAALKFAGERRMSVFPRGVSSSAFGGVVPTRNGMVLDLSPMMGILAIDLQGLTARVQPGVRWADLASRLERCGLAPVTTPSSRFSTVGGWAATGGLGIDGFGYGPFSRAVAGIRVALMDGSVLQMTDKDSGFPDFLGTEGQLGVLTEITLRVKPKADFSSPLLVRFNSAVEAFDFLGWLSGAGEHPAHVVFYDQQRMAEENRLFRDRTGRDDNIAEERDTVLLHFDSEHLEKRFLDSIKPEAGLAPSDKPAARYLWTERFFPLKSQRLGPGLLAGEVVLSRESVPLFVERARKMSLRFGIRPAIEVIVSRCDGGTEACVAIVSFTCDPTASWRYLLSLLLVQIIVDLGVRLKGRPYGFGIWNAPFFAGSHSSGDRRRLMRRKQELDPQNLLNPNKFFRIRTRFLNLPGLIFHPAIFRTSLKVAAVFSPLLGAVARIGLPRQSHQWLVPSPEEEGGLKLAVQTALRCASCGSCVSACPAYVLTCDELVTGRSKLRMAEAWLSGEEICASEAHRSFQCLRCGLCEEVCQTRLPLRECYTVLERWVEKRHGYPQELIRGFVTRVDGDRELIRSTFGLDLPEWSADGPGLNLQDVQRKLEVKA